MKKYKFFQLLMIALISGSLLTFYACSDDDDDDVVVVDKTELAATIQEAEDLIEDTSEGSAEGQYQVGSQAILQEVIDLAKAVYDDPEATQTQVDNAVVNLAQAIEDYLAKEIVPIAPDALVGHWTFDEGSGNIANDFSGNNFHGTLKEDESGAWGGGMPEWTTDRYGNEGKALFFNEGAHVLIPNNLAFTPPNISISLWVKAAETLENNRFIGINRWNTWKFQLQSVNKSFFTINTTEGIYDRDAEPELELDTWYHLTVTFGGGNMIFYVNGTETQKWENTPGTALPDSENELCIGRDSPLENSGYFHGAIDEVRIYNTVLTGTQVQAIYDQEKP